MRVLPEFGRLNVICSSAALRAMKVSVESFPASVARAARDI